MMSFYLVFSCDTLNLHLQEKDILHCLVWAVCCLGLVPNVLVLLVLDSTMLTPGTVLPFH